MSVPGSKNFSLSAHLLATLTVAGISLSPTLAQAALDQGGVVAPGGFVSVYSGLTQGESFLPGADVATVHAHSIGEQSFAGNGSINASSGFNQARHVNSGSGTASLGVIQGSAMASSMNYFTSFSSVSIVNAGWVDTLTIFVPGSLGEQAVLESDMSVTAVLTGAGFNGSATIGLLPYLDQQPLMRDTVGFDPGGSYPLSTTLQTVRWAERNDDIGGSDTRIVNDVATFAAPITIGTPFDLGFFAPITAGATNNASFSSLLTTANADAINTVLWDGISGLTVNGLAVADF